MTGTELQTLSNRGQPACVDGDRAGTRPLVAVYVVTYRRHEMLRRAIASVLAQTHEHLLVYVVNDDPADAAVGSIVEAFGHPRAVLFRPVEKRGATRNFNLVFRESEADYAALLEDDNWWESTFLERQIEVLERHPEAPLVVGNERVWRELPDGGWLDTGATIWPFADVQLHTVTLERICGSAKICNSLMLVRVNRPTSLLTPETIPVDVTEHFRERLLPRHILLNGAPLVNYADTIHTARDRRGSWGLYQVILIGSVFIALPHAGSRRRLAAALWDETRSPVSPRATTLVHTGLAIREARELLRLAPVGALLRTAVSLCRHPGRVFSLRRVQEALGEHLHFLVTAPLTRELAEIYLS
jgi:glycosyltransferase involved in cell wall biosynthesis